MRKLSSAMRPTALLFLCLAAITLLPGCAAPRAPSMSTPAVIALDPTCTRSIGGVSQFRREQFITLHAAPAENELTPADYRFLEKELEVSYGRELRKQQAMKTAPETRTADGFCRSKVGHFLEQWKGCRSDRRLRTERSL